MKRFVIKTTKIFAVLVMVFCTLSFASSPDQKIRTGSTVQIVNDCIGCLDEATLDAAIKYANQKNDVMFASIAKSKNSVILTKGTKAEVVRIRIGKVRIKLSDNRMMWVKYSSVKPTK